MIHLLNSAVMPIPGHYNLESITAQDFATLLAAAARVGNLTSYIGYPDTAAIVFSLSGVKVAISREQTNLNNEDGMLILRLKYRVQNPADKGKFTPKKEDFEFFFCTYYTE